MGFWTFLSATGLVLGSFMFAFSLAGVWVDGGPGWSRTVGWTMLRMLIVVAVTSLTLFESAVITPHWLQYSLLIGVPAALGFLSCRHIVRRWSAENESTE